jgi:Fe-S-cluster-containing dehydrogenase component/CRP-like cAMP-binding protein
MPLEHQSRRDVLAAIDSIPSIAQLLATHDGHFDYEIDLEVVVYGRNYNGKKVGPYLRLLTYEPGESIVNEGEWGGNTFFVLVKGEAEVFVNSQDGQSMVQVAKLAVGAQFGEMSVLGGVPRNATIKAPQDATVDILEIQRPALRLLRKLTKFSDALDQTYRLHGRNSAIDRIKTICDIPDELITDLRDISVFRVYTKNHVLFHEGAPVDRVYLFMTGWVRRGSGPASDSHPSEDFLGDGHCLGSEGIIRDLKWPYTATLLGRTEVLELTVSRLRKKVALRGLLSEELFRLEAPEFLSQYAGLSPAVKEKTVAAQSGLIETGLVDGNNLLVMDMALCVRCGNCSLACHKVHGQSRLLRRGIHLTRLKSPRLGAVQSILSPQVCMHCEDPECLTGCPTGAIGRFGAGQIDINPKTCIGCGDCATQCPYDAISMASRSAKPPAPVTGLGNRIRQLLRLSPDPLPPAVEQTEDLVAVKCNLCSGTSLNPPGAAGAAYSCEENCPTGALARVSPSVYFSEIANTKGLLRVDDTHAIARNIHRSDPPRRAMHILGVLLVLISTGAAVWGLRTYGLGIPLVSFLNMRWITGLVGLVAIAAVMTYPLRKQMYLRRRGPLRYWMLFHTYLGAVAAIMIFLHGGRNSGGALTTALMLSFDFTILTGVIGIIFYVLVPRLLTKMEETPLLIDDLKGRREELSEELASLQGSALELARKVIKNKIIPRFVSIRYILAQYFTRRPLDAEIARSKKKARRQIAAVPDGLARQQVEHAVELASTAGRVDSLVYLHRLLKIWLAPHIVFTSLMLALLLVHIVQVIYYASR